MIIGSLPDNSPKSVDYSRLEKLLKAGDWKGAVQETLNLMLQATNRTQQGWLDSKSLQNFPCEVLRRLDDLWLKYSDGKFGFSVQRKIWEEVGSPTEHNAQWEQFGDRVGWRKNGQWIPYSSVTFGISAPPGHLPVFADVGGGLGWVFGTILSRCSM